jgi:hypothetical protein
MGNDIRIVIKPAIFKTIAITPLITFSTIAIYMHDSFLKDLSGGSSFDHINGIFTMFLFILLAYAAVFKIVALKIEKSKIYIYQIGDWKLLDPSEIEFVTIKNQQLLIYTRKSHIFGPFSIAGSSSKLMDACSEIQNIIEEQKATVIPGLTGNPVSHVKQ